MAIPDGVGGKEGGHGLASFEDAGDVRLRRAEEKVARVRTHLERVGMELGDRLRVQKSIWKEQFSLVYRARGRRWQRPKFGLKGQDQNLVS